MGKLTRRQGHFCRAASSRPLPASGGPFSGPATSFAFPPQSSSAAMLSRALLRAGLARNALSQVRPVSTTSAKAGSIPAWVDGVDIFENEKNPERDHVGMVFAIAIVGVANVVGPGLTKSLDATIDKEIADMDSIRNKEIDRCALAIEEEEKSQWMAGSYEDLIAAKKEN